MTHMPELIWAKAEMEYGAIVIGRFADTVRYLPEGTMYRRADLPPKVDAARLDQVLRDLITEQSEGEWDDGLIEKDVKVFSAAILAALVQP